MTWAQIIDGVACNPVTTDPAQCFTAAWLASNPPFVEAPDGTLHGARDNGDGTFTNPTQGAATASWDEFDFRRRFTREERKTILAASKVNDDIAEFEALLQAAGRTGTRIHADDPDLIDGVTALETGGLIAEGRAAEILGL